MCAVVKKCVKRPTYLHASFLFPAEFDFTKLALANGIPKDELAKFSLLFSPRVIVATPSAASGLVHLVSHGDYGGRCRIIVLLVRGLLWTSQRQAFLFSLNVHLWLGNQDAIQYLACFSRRPVG